MYDFKESASDFIEYLAKETQVFKLEKNLLVFYIEKIKIQLYLWYNNCSEIQERGDFN